MYQVVMFLVLSDLLTNEAALFHSGVFGNLDNAL